MDLENNKIIKTNLCPYVYRQKTQEIMYMVKNKEFFTNHEKKEWKTKMKSLFKNIRKYLRSFVLVKEEESMMKMLCDDLSIIYQTIDYSNGAMYALSRFTSQGRQQAYTVSPKKNHLSYMEKDDPCSQPDISLLSLTRENNIFTPITNTRMQNQAYGDEENKLGLVTQEEEEQEKQILEYEKFLLEEEGINEYLNYHEAYMKYYSHVFENMEKEEKEDDIENYDPCETNTSCYATQGIIDTIEELSSFPY
jgi:hypothetical protein